MATLIQNEFASFELTDKEALQGSLLTTVQMQVIQNQLANAAMEKIHLEYDASNPTAFIQQEASLKGQLDAYNFLLEASVIAKEELTNPTPQD